ncbi:glycosyltransferase [Candidatus Dojkabacteria bacterium]|nr:glycosyltransferase [Candidatus Dojkabacteria bacterium]
MRNTNEPMFVITSYPPKGSLHGKKVGGVASFAKNTLDSMKGYRFTVLSEVIDEQETYTEGQNTIIRCWKRDSINLFSNILKAITQYEKKEHHQNKLLVEFEFGIYGNPFITGLIPLLLILLKLKGYEITIVLHQVLSNLSELAPHLGIKKNSISSKVQNLLLQLYYKVLQIIVDKIIVLDEIHKQKLVKNRTNKKIFVIAHGVENINLSKIQKEPLSIRDNDPETKVITCFGFVTWYKGIDLVIDSFSKYLKDNPQNPYKIKLLIAGGESPTQKESPDYQKFYRNIEEKVKKISKHAELTGFIQESDIPKIYQDSDILIFPYRTLMSSSGPLSLAIAYEKPFVISKILEPYTLTYDLNRALQDGGLTTRDITVDFDNPDSVLNIIDILKNKDQLAKIKQVAHEVKLQRCWSVLGDRYKEVIQSPKG